MGVYEHIIEDQRRLNLIPPLHIQPSSLAICGSCRGDILRLEEEPGQPFEPYQGLWSPAGKLTYYHERCSLGL